MTTVPSAFAAAVRTDPTRPLLTWYDDTTGERTELSGATLANWVAKTANLLVDGCGLGSGDVATVDLPPHWQTAAILLACWSAGLSVETGGTGKGDVAFVGTGQAAAAPDTFAVGLHPFALPVRDLPAGVTDWVTAARVHGDHFGGSAAGPDDLAYADLTQARLCERAGAKGLPAGERVIYAVTPAADVLDWLVAPLVAGCTMVACVGADASTLERRAGMERARVVSL
ncbi:TIGR03089 family protein [Hamadaea tsunoensis]|uniref:TIGR03089 family protein n=1 Tax=Hamadaea tsunoensis TaxID=53368 RepID=UPI0003FE9831|nr:TIGR03089 family protein [Hamadaea tsunoensis]